jgi:methyl-accepting chemotaxis protein
MKAWLGSRITRILLISIGALLAFAAVVMFVTKQNVESAMLDQARSQSAFATKTQAAFLLRLGPPAVRDGNLTFGTTAVNGTTGYVDEIKTLTGAENTIFEIQDGKPIRVATTIVKADGTRATGTELVGPARKAIDRGEAYSGISVILGKNYMATYTPFADGSGKQIGLYFTGVPLSSVEGAVARTMLSIVAIDVLAIAAVVAILVGVLRLLRRDVVAITRAAQTIAGGNLTQAVRVDGNDEIAQLSTSLDAMRVKLLEVFTGVDALASGDLSHEIVLAETDKDGVFAKLEMMRRNFAGIVTRIAEAGSSISASSEAIAKGNVNLSERTEQQASSLEETAASMEELTSTVKQNSNSAQEANVLGKGASDAARKGGEVMLDVVTTMDAINGSSSKIVEIISVIDGIAFQTNILALNAAVEAARAGEQGRGFAVVAGEVRSLAQRSSAAAKEIKALIDDTVSKVGNGTQLVKRAGETVQDVVNSVKRVTDILDDIAAASREQSSGIDQVSIAVTQMDQVTQQNAALVEEAAGAALSLQDEAKALIEAVSAFRVDAQHAALPGAAIAARRARVPSRQVALN